jgi:hypothetical protein
MNEKDLQTHLEMRTTYVQTACLAEIQTAMDLQAFAVQEAMAKAEVDSPRELKNINVYIGMRFADRKTATEIHSSDMQKAVELCPSTTQIAGDEAEIDVPKKIGDINAYL